jgi:hypothetical protein
VKNAHLRFGSLTYTKVFKKTSTRLRIPLDRFVGESELGSEVKAHFISVVGGDTQIAAAAAAIGNGEGFTVEDPDQNSFRAALGTNATCYRSSLQLDSNRRPLRHLVAVSEEFTTTGYGINAERTIIFDDSPQFIWTSLACIHGLPGAPSWDEWIVQEVRKLNGFRSLIGIGCKPVLVRASKGLLMNCISRGVRAGKLRFPEENGPVQWGRVGLSELLVREAVE